MGWGSALIKYGCKVLKPVVKKVSTKAGRYITKTITKLGMSDAEKLAAKKVEAEAAARLAARRKAAAQVANGAKKEMLEKSAEAATKKAAQKSAKYSTAKAAADAAAKKAAVKSATTKAAKEVAKKEYKAAAKKATQLKYNNSNWFQKLGFKQTWTKAIFGPGTRRFAKTFANTKGSLLDKLGAGAKDAYGLVKRNGLWKCAKGQLKSKTLWMLCGAFELPNVYDAYKNEGPAAAAAEVLKAIPRIATGVVCSIPGKFFGGFVGEMGLWTKGEEIASKIFGAGYSEKLEKLESYLYSPEEITRKIADGKSLDDVLKEAEEQRKINIETLKNDYGITQEDMDAAGLTPEETLLNLEAYDITKDVVEQYKNQYSAMDLLNACAQEENENAQKLIQEYGLTEDEVSDYDVVELASKIQAYGITKQDIQNAHKNNQTINDILLSKSVEDYEVTEEELKNGKAEAIIENKDKDMRTFIRNTLQCTDAEIDKYCKVHHCTVPQIYRAQKGQSAQAVDAQQPVEDPQGESSVQQQEVTGEQEEVASEQPQQQDVTGSQEEVASEQPQQQDVTGSQEDVASEQPQQQDVTSAQEDVASVDPQDATSQSIESELASTSADGELSTDDKVYMEMIKEYIKDKDGVEITDEKILAVCQNNELTLENMYKKLVGNENADSDEMYLQKIKEIILMADQTIITTEKIQDICAEHNITPKEMYEKIYSDIYKSAA